jgi:hypothetical protein
MEAKAYLVLVSRTGDISLGIKIFKLIGTVAVAAGCGEGSVFSASLAGSSPLSLTARRPFPSDDLGHDPLALALCVPTATE